MKKYFFLFAIAALAACSNNKVQDFIPGTYVHHVQGEYGSADDTLIMATTDDVHYTITRNTGFVVIRNHKRLPKRRQVQHLSGTYDAASQTLTESTKGRSFTFDSKAGTLTTNRGGIYQKLN